MGGAVRPLLRIPPETPDTCLPGKLLCARSVSPATLMMSDWKEGYGWTDMWLFCVYLYFPALLCLAAGGIPVHALWRKEQEQMAELEEKAKSRPSYYNT